MNTVEHIVECYYRICRNCFTMQDVKVHGGNNRQFDLLAISLLDGEQYHVESSVTHSWDWYWNTDNLLKEFERKFFGVPPKREGKNTDFAKGKSYLPQIVSMYRAVGMIAERINRVFCTWTYPSFDGYEEAVSAFSKMQNVRPIKVISFRDTILPALEQCVGTANYEDEALRTLSLLNQRKFQLSDPKPVVSAIAPFSAPESVVS